MKLAKTLYCVLFLLFLLPFSHAQLDLKNQEDTESSFILSTTEIEIQRDQTELEKQSIAKETEYRIKLEARRRIINELISVYTSAFRLIFVIVTGLFLLAMLRLLKFITIDFVIILFNKLISSLDARFSK